MTHIRTAVLLLAIVVAYVWVISEGRFTHWTTRTTYYSRLADGFLHGQTNLLTDPDPRLLATPDPYDPHYNSALRLHDAALYKGKYYVYWGPVPALLLMPARLLAHRPDDPIGDQCVVFAFATALLLVSSLLIVRVRRRFFPEQPEWTVAFGILIAGLANPLPFLLASAAVYPAAIVSGQFFLLAGIYLAWVAIETRSSTAAAGLLLTAGSCWAMAFGCRISLAPAIAALTGLVAWGIWSQRSRWPDWEQRSKRIAVLRCAWLTLPILAGSLLFAAYNIARFGSPVEFGARYVLAGQNMHAMVANGSFVSFRNVAINLVRYLFELPSLETRFPFISPYGVKVWDYFGIVVNKDYIVDCVAGMIWAAPAFGMAAVPLWARLRSIAGHGRKVQCPPERAPLADGRTSGWLTLVLITASVLGILPSLAVAASTMRYLADATPSLAILASMGIWMQLRDSADGRNRSRRLRAIAVLTAYSAVIGILLAVPGILH